VKEMFIRLKGNETEFTTTSIIEQKLYKQGASTGWLLSLNLSGGFTAQDIDGAFTEEGISEITLVGETKENTVISGYAKVTSCVVRYGAEKNTAEIQLVKGV
jgi:hypothetical protein